MVPGLLRDLHSLFCSGMSWDRMLKWCGSLCRALGDLNAERLHSWSKLKLDKLSVPELEGSAGGERRSWNKC